MATVTNNDLERRVAAVESSLALVAQEQTHLREILHGGIQNISQQIALLSAKLDTITQQGEVGRSDPVATPAGRQLLAEIEAIKLRSREREQEAIEREADLEAVLAWQSEIKGQLTLLKWAAGGGLLGAAGLILRLLGVPVP